MIGKWQLTSRGTAHLILFLFGLRFGLEGSLVFLSCTASQRKLRLDDGNDAHSQKLPLCRMAKSSVATANQTDPSLGLTDGVELTLNV